MQRDRDGDTHADTNTDTETDRAISEGSEKEKKHARLSNDQRYIPTHQESYSHTCATDPKEKGDNTAHMPLAWGSGTHVNNESGIERNGKGKLPR